MFSDTELDAWHGFVLRDDVPVHYHVDPDDEVAIALRVGNPEVLTLEFTEAKARDVADLLQAAIREVAAERCAEADAAASKADG